jgi:hypothetical protein
MNGAVAQQKSPEFFNYCCTWQRALKALEALLTPK